MTPSERVIRFINIAHALDHMLMLIFATAVLGMGGAFGASYGELLKLSLGGFIAFGAGSLPAGWLGDVWSRRNMMAVFFIGVGAAAVLTGFSTSRPMLAAFLTLVGVFASIYHPVGTAMLTAHAEKLGRAIGVNGVWGNLGVAFAALVTGTLMEFLGWRAAFVVPGLASVAVGIAFLALVPDDRPARKAAQRPSAPIPRSVVIHAFAVLALVTVAGSLVFNATTVAMPKVFDERLTALAHTPLGVGVLAAIIFTLGAVSQLIVGRLVDKHPLRTVFLPLAALQAPSLLFAAWAENWLMLALAAAMMFAIFGQVTINDAMVARYTSQEWRARAYALRYVMSFGASAGALPLVAYLHDRAGGFGPVFIVMAGFGLLVFLGAVLFPHRPEELEALGPEPLAAE